MKSLLLVGRKKDSALEQQLKRLGYQTLSVEPDDVSSKSVNHDICVINWTVNDEFCWPVRVARTLEHRMLMIVIVEQSMINQSEVIRFISQYAWDYHTAPVDIDRFNTLLGHVFGLARLKKNQYRVQNGGGNSCTTSSSAAMQDLTKMVEKVAPTNIPILIRGESGTGKELIARQLHSASDRSLGPFIAVNCGAIASQLVQSELFGHEKGAFTGAVASHKGKIAQANGGTLFLDEIGDLPLEQQTNLLRFLQEGKFDSVGGHIYEADVRVVAATHVDIEDATSRGNFRLDLYYRLNGVTVELPALRERHEDIIPLAEEFIKKYSEEYRIEAKSLTHRAKAMLEQYHWPGNIRELINLVRRAVVLSDKNVIDRDDLDLMYHTDSLPCCSLKELKDEVEKKAIETAIRDANGGFVS